jgi:hypothetical protein
VDHGKWDLWRLHPDAEVDIETTVCNPTGIPRYRQRSSSLRTGAERVWYL